MGDPRGSGGTLSQNSTSTLTSPSGPRHTLKGSPPVVVIGVRRGERRPSADTLAGKSHDFMMEAHPSTILGQQGTEAELHRLGVSGLTRRFWPLRPQMWPEVIIPILLPLPAELRPVIRGNASSAVNVRVSALTVHLRRPQSLRVPSLPAQGRAPLKGTCSS